MKRITVLLLASFVAALFASEAKRVGQPNILWLIAEDMSPHLGCYGDQVIATPNVDRLA
ncbi:MAG: hypothetical protein RL077_4520, partial [Verrucomicrobiota bacterium]